MATETIQIVFEPLGALGGTTYFHETLLYTRSDGQKLIASCYPTAEGPQSLAGNLGAMYLGLLNAPATFGKLECWAGAIDDPAAQALWPRMFEDGAGGAILAPNNPSVTVASAPSLAAQWNIIVQAESEITAQEFNYSPLTRNSNSAATTALKAAGITAPQGTEHGGPFWAPAANQILPTSLTPGGPDTGPTLDPLGNVISFHEINVDGSITSFALSATGQLDITGVRNGESIYTASQADNSNGIVRILANDVVLHVSGVEVTLEDGAEATLIGENNDIFVLEHGDLVSYGGGNTIHADADDRVLIGRTDGTFSDVIGSGLNSGGMTADGQATGIYLEESSQAHVLGAGNSVTLATGNSLGIYGGGNEVHSGVNDLVVIGDTAGVETTVYANNSQFYGQTANGQGTGIHVEANSQIKVVGTNNGVKLVAGDTAAVYGSGNTIHSGAGVSLTVGQTNGVAAQIYANGQELGEFAADGDGTGIFVESDSQVDVYGSNNGVDLSSGNSAGVYGGGNDIHTGAGNLVVIGDTNGVFDDIYSNDSVAGGVTANGQGTGIYFRTGSQAHVLGDNNTVAMSTLGSLGIYGSGNEVHSGVNDLVVVGDTDGIATVIYAEDTQLFGATANGQGTGIHVDADSQVVVHGSNNGLELRSGNSAAVYGGGNVVYAAADVHLTVGDTGGDFTEIHADGLAFGGLAADGQSTGIFVQEDSQVDVWGEKNGVDLTTGNSAGIYGGGNTVYAGFNDLVVLGDTDGDFSTVYADGAMFGYTTANGQGTGIFLNDNAQVNVVGSYNGIQQSTGNSSGVYGGANTINTGAGNLVVVADTEGLYTTVNSTGNQFGGSTANGQPTGIHVHEDSQVNVWGSNNGIALAEGDSAGIYGGGNTIYAFEDSLVVVGNTNGSFDHVIANGVEFGGATANGQGTGIFLEENSQANISGSDNSIQLATGNSAGIYGGNNTISAGQGDLVVISETNGRPDTVFLNGIAYGGTTANGQPTGVHWSNTGESWNHDSDGSAHLPVGDTTSVSGAANAQYRPTLPGNGLETAEFVGNQIIWDDGAGNFGFVDLNNLNYNFWELGEGGTARHSWKDGSGDFGWTVSDASGNVFSRDIYDYGVNSRGLQMLTHTFDEQGAYAIDGVRTSLLEETATGDMVQVGVTIANFGLYVNPNSSFTGGRWQESYSHNEWQQAESVPWEFQWDGLDMDTNIYDWDPNQTLFANANQWVDVNPFPTIDPFVTDVNSWHFSV